MQLKTKSLIVIAVLVAGMTIGRPESAAVKLTVEPGHPWTAPFGVERVGRPLDAVVDVPSGVATGDAYELVGLQHGREVSRRRVKFIDEKLNFLTEESDPRYRFGRVTLDDWPSQVALFKRSGSQQEWMEMAREPVLPPDFEAEAEARAVQPVNPVDLGAILPPAKWLLSEGGKSVNVRVAALSRADEFPNSIVSAWFGSAPDVRTTLGMALNRNEVAQVELLLPASPTGRTEDTLHVAITDGAGRKLWRKEIRAMLVPEPPRWPAFGAVKTKLRYDAAIPLPNGKTLDYKKGWDPKLEDTVVFLPNGGRLVFWRGSRNIPFWAGRGNTGFSYQWAERGIPFNWSEALLDHEAKFSRVEIVESTEAKVHVRWHYRAVDEHGNAPTGDYYVEDFHLYPDGFGTRVLTLTCIPEASYEVNEFIPITPAGGYPLRMLPVNMLDLLWVGGEKAAFEFPFLVGDQREQVAIAEAKAKGRMIVIPPLGTVPLSVPSTDGPVYRIRIGNDDPLAVVQYNPDGWGPTWPGNFLPGLFGPQFDRGAVVTRAYWGYHWPLSRVGGLGASDKNAIDLSPAHNSIVTTGWTVGPQEPSPSPIRRERLWTRDGNGVMKRMRRDTLTWFIGMTDASDDELRLRAQSYREPPGIEVHSASFNADSFYSRERRALCLTMDEGSRSITITIASKVPFVNPVFEIERAPGTLNGVLIGGKPLDRTRYAWDGRTLWLDLILNQPAELQINFSRANASGLK